jgi:Ala-tRNA(Pro) deacylase
MTTLDQCLNYLDSNHVRYVHTIHSAAYSAEEVAKAEHMPPHRFAKTVVFLANGCPAMVVVPGDLHVDVEQLRTAMGIAAVLLADEADLAVLFPNMELGAMPPLGTLFGRPVYLDRSVAEQEFIAFNAGTHRDLIHMRSEDFQRLVRPVTGKFSDSTFSSFDRLAMCKACRSQRAKSADAKVVESLCSSSKGGFYEGL